MAFDKECPKHACFKQIIFGKRFQFLIEDLLVVFESIIWARNLSVLGGRRSYPMENGEPF
jgi:hypothetical protein